MIQPHKAKWVLGYRLGVFMARNELTIILVLFVAVVLLMALVEFFKKKSEVIDAKTFILEDLKQNYPGADIEIITMKEKFNEKNERYNEIKAKVTVNQNMPCPQRMHLYYNYPEQNFVPQTPEYITLGCKVCVASQCNIIFPEEAIIASHTLDGTEDVQAFVDTYNNARALTNENATAWVVLWSANNSDYSMEVKLLKNGTVVSKTKLFKDQ